METTEKRDLHQKMEDEKNDATKPFPNAQNDSAAKINRGVDPNARNYNNKKDAGPEGPNWNKKSDGAEGDTGQNAGVFK